MIEKLLYKKKLDDIREGLDGFIGQFLNLSYSNEEKLSNYSMAMPMMAKPKAAGRQALMADRPRKAAKKIQESVDSMEMYCAEAKPGCVEEVREETVDAVESMMDLEEVLSNKKESFSTMLLRLIDERELKDSEVYKKANIDRRLFSKIRGDEDYLPSKKTAIAFCIALRLDVKESKKLLESAGYTLSDSSRFDLIIMYLINQGEYDIHFINIVLTEYGEGSLYR